MSWVWCSYQKAYFSWYYKKNRVLLKKKGVFYWASKSGISVEKGVGVKEPGSISPAINISSYQYGNSHYENKTVPRLSCVHDRNPHTHKDRIFYWDGTQKCYHRRVQTSKQIPNLFCCAFCIALQETPKLFCCSVWKLDLFRCSVYAALQGTPNRPVAQTPQYTSPTLHNAPFCNRNVHRCAHFCYKMVHCGIFVMRCGVCEAGLFILLFSVHSIIGNIQPILWLCLHCITGTDKLILSVCLYCITGKIGLILLRSLHFITENRNHYTGPFALHYRVWCSVFISMTLTGTSNLFRLSWWRHGTETFSISLALCTKFISLNHNKEHRISSAAQFTWHYKEYLIHCGVQLTLYYKELWIHYAVPFTQHYKELWIHSTAPFTWHNKEHWIQSDV